MKKYIVLIFSLLSIIVGCSETVAEISEDSIIVENPDPVEPVDNSNVSGKNILFIVADDLTKTLSSYGHPVVKTPNIDRLAAMGVQFNNAYSNYSVCNPSRSSFLTGMKPETTTIMDNHVHLQDIIQDWVTLPALYKKNGFYTMSLGKIFHTSKEEDNDLKAWNEIYSYHRSDSRGVRINRAGVHRRSLYWVGQRHAVLLSCWQKQNQQPCHRPDQRALTQRYAGVSWVSGAR